MKHEPDIVDIIMGGICVLVLIKGAGIAILVVIALITSTS